MKKKSLSYASSGVRYDIMDPVKKNAQKAALSTAANLKHLGMTEVAASRGESAYVWEEKDSYRAFVMEGLGTKNLVADAMQQLTGKSYYRSIAQDTVAAIINDLIVVGATPQVVNAYFAVGSSEWLNDQTRAKDLVEGFADACNLAGAVWGGGETPTLNGIINEQTIDLGGSAVGVIQPKSRLVLGDKLADGDAIVFIESSGIHTNGLTLARKIASVLKKGFATPLPNGKSFGETLLTPSYIYAKLVNQLFEKAIDIHYMVHITGHGFRKLMRATNPFTYEITDVPKPPAIFDFIQEHSGTSDEEMYGNFNMGIGFAIYTPAKHVDTILSVAKNNKLNAWQAGFVKNGQKQVIIGPKEIVFKEKSLGVR